MKPDLKAGDIIFWSPNDRGQFYIVLESTSGNISGKFKVFSSYGSKLSVHSSLSQLKYISEGFWEYNYWD